MAIADQTKQVAPSLVATGTYTVLVTGLQSCFASNDFKSSDFVLYTVYVNVASASEINYHQWP
jgi:hypothetical protein